MPGLDAAGVSAARRTGPGKTIQNVRSAYHSRSLLGQHTACRIGVIRVIEDQITTLRPYNARYTGDPRSIFRKRYTEMITHVSLVRSGRDADRSLDLLLSVHLICAVLHGGGDTAGRTMFTRCGATVGSAVKRLSCSRVLKMSGCSGAENPPAPGPRPGEESRVGWVSACLPTCPGELVRESRPSGGWDSGRPAARP